MHEIELGVWKNLFIHLLRMLEATDKALTLEFNRRYYFDNSPIGHLYAYNSLYPFQVQTDVYIWF